MQCKDVSSMWNCVSAYRTTLFCIGHSIHSAKFEVLLLACICKIEVLEANEFGKPPSNCTSSEQAVIIDNIVDTLVLFNEKSCFQTNSKCFVVLNAHNKKHTFVNSKFVVQYSYYKMPIFLDECSKGAKYSSPTRS